MNTVLHGEAFPAGIAAGSIFVPAVAALDDAALLAHFRRERAVRYYPVADPDETRADRIEAIMAGWFEFNGERHRLTDPVAWLANPSHDVEWHILLHKFYYVVGLGMAFTASGERRYAERWMRLVDGWIAATPPGFIAADVTGRRVQNWIYSYHHFVTHAAGDAVDPAFHRRLLVSLHEQVEYLCANLTPARNHRTLELYAIFLAAVVFPEMRRATHWLRFALARIVQNIASDLLADGVQCELSTDYHHLVVKNYLNVRRLAALNAIAVPKEMDDALLRALEFSLHAHKPDGIVPSLSDGDARGYLDLLALGADLFGREDFRWVATAGTQGVPPARRVAHFAASGYTVVRSHWGDEGEPYADAQHMIFDCGPLGAGNHGHFDCLSFELAAYGRSLVVDPGRFTYSEAGDTNWRVRFRGTAAHNTVCVDGRDQTLYLPRPIKEGSRHAAGTVRHKVCGPAPEATLVESATTDHLTLLHGRARSDVYDAVHSRRIVFVDGGYWIVSDWMDAPTPHGYTLRFQLGEAAQNRLSLTRNPAPTARSPGLVIAQPADPAVRVGIEESWVSYRYGEKLAAPRVCFTTRAARAGFDTVLVPWRDDAPPLRVTRPAIWREAGEEAQGCSALCIESVARGKSFRDLWLYLHSDETSKVRCGTYRFRGRWLWVREDAAGRVLAACSDATASLARGRSLIPTNGRRA